MVPSIGVKPTTYWLQINCSIGWATKAWDKPAVFRRELAPAGWLNPVDEEANVIVANERHIVVVMPNLPDGQAIFVDDFVHAVVGILTGEEFFSVFSEFDADGRQRISMTREGDVVVFKHLTRPPIYTRLG